MHVKVYSETGNIPEYATEGSACFDIRAMIKPNPEKGVKHTIYIGSGEFAIVGTGLYFEIPKGFAMTIHSRSGHGFKNAVSLANGQGILDSDFRGELKIVIINHGTEVFIIEDGDRIAQGKIDKLIPVIFKTVESKEELSLTQRGEEGFGHTGVK